MHCAQLVNAHSQNKVNVVKVLYSNPAPHGDERKITQLHTALLHQKRIHRRLVGSLKMNTALEYSTRVVQEGDRRCKKSTLNDLAYLTPLRIPLMNPVVIHSFFLYTAKEE
jgi:hypothetical protein